MLGLSTFENLRHLCWNHLEFVFLTRQKRTFVQMIGWPDEKLEMACGVGNSGSAAEIQTDPRRQITTSIRSTLIPLKWKKESKLNVNVASIAFVITHHLEQTTFPSCINLSWPMIFPAFREHM
jgi:hypothetical protein